jgi:hypothetical protein
MLIALLAVLGVDLIVLVVLLAFVLARKRWVKRQPESFRGVIRLSGGELDGFGRSGHAGTDAGSATCWSGPRARFCSATPL